MGGSHPPPLNNPHHHRHAQNQQPIRATATASQASYIVTSR